MKLKDMAPNDLTELLKDRTTKDIILIKKGLDGILDEREAQLKVSQQAANQELTEINDAKNGK